MFGFGSEAGFARHKYGGCAQGYERSHDKEGQLVALKGVKHEPGEEGSYNATPYAHWVHDPSDAGITPGAEKVSYYGLLSNRVGSLAKPIG